MFLTGSVMLIALAVAFGVGCAVWLLTRHHGMAVDKAACERLAQACEAGAALAYGVMAETGVAGATTGEKASAIAVGVQHVINSVPDVIYNAKLSTAHIQDMVLARYGGLLAVDPTVTVGPGPIIASAMAAAARVVQVKPTNGK